MMGALVLLGPLSIILLVQGLSVFFLSIFFSCRLDGEVCLERTQRIGGRVMAITALLIGLVWVGANLLNIFNK